MLKKYTLIIFLTFLIVFKSQSQTENYPVSATLVFAAPFSLKVSDYFTSNNRMYLNLNLKDLTKPTLKVYLKWSLEGPGIHIATRDGFIPTSFIELSKGTVSLQRGSDLSLYFQRGMLDYQGIDEGVVFNGSIPEGFYTMKFQALEAGSGREVSNLSESFFFVTSPQPPIINQPFNGSIVPVTNPQNVLLQWTPRQISTLESQVVYEVTIYEVADGDDPVVVSNSGILPKFNRTVSTTSTLMGASDLPLQEGKRYAMVVTAKDLNGKMNFENGGKSEVSWFQYGKACFAPAGLDVAETAPGKVILSWTPNTTAEGYVIEYKKKDETKWTVNGSLDNSFTLNGLSPKTDYEFRVKTQCSGGKYSAYTATESVSVIGLITPTPETEVSLDDVLDPFSQTVSTKNDGTPFDPKNLDALLALLKPPACAVSGVSYVCGQTPNATPPVGIDLTTLAKGNVLGIYDYAVLVTEVSKGSSPFTGKGLVKLPFAGNIKVPVEFKGIKAKKGEDGKDGGCVWYVPADLNEGYFQVKGSQQDAIVKEQEKLLADIYSELIDPESFYGTFEEALAKYEAKSKEIEEKEAKGEVVDKKDYQELIKYLHGVVQGGSDWKAKLVDYMGGDASDPAIKEILDDFDALKKDLSDCEKCLVDNLSSPVAKPGGGGPLMPDFNNLGKQPCPKPKNLKKKVKALTAKVADYTNPEDTKNFVDILKLINAVNGTKNDQADFTSYFKLPDYLTAPEDLYGRNIENKDRYSKEYCLRNVMLEDGHKYKKLCIKNKENGGEYKTFTQYKGNLLENSDKNGFKFLKSTAIDHPPYDAYTEFGRFEITTNTLDEGDLKNYLEGKIPVKYKPQEGEVDIEDLHVTDELASFVEKQEARISYVYDDALGGNSRFCKKHGDHGGVTKGGFCKKNDSDGRATVGIGHLISSSDELALYCGKEPLGDDEITKLFRQTDLIEKGEDRLKKLLKGVKITQCKFDALVSIAFNRSPTTFKKAKNDNQNWINIAKGQWVGLSDEEILDGFGSAGAGLSSEQKNVLNCRRPSEADIFMKCDYTKRVCSELPDCAPCNRKK